MRTLHIPFTASRTDKAKIFEVAIAVAVEFAVGVEVGVKVEVKG